MFIHIADIHACMQFRDDVLDSLNQITQFIEQKEPNAIIVSGDTWDGTTPLGQAIIEDVIAVLKQWPSICKCHMIYGTPSHDNRGSLDIFENFGWNVHPNSTSDCATVIDLDGFGVGMYHGDLTGAVTTTGYRAEGALPTGAVDYWALGHIHKFQIIRKNGVPCVYPGSVYPTDYGETEDKGFIVVYPEKRSPGKNNWIEFHKLDTPRMVTESHTAKSLIDYQPEIGDYTEKTKLRYRLSYPEGQESMLGRVYELVGHEIAKHDHIIDLKWDPIVVPSNRQRSEIQEKESFEDELVEWGRVNNVEITSNILAKSRALVKGDWRGIVAGSV